jgi:DNA-binding transcriptional LysR family regulator
MPACPSEQARASHVRELSFSAVPRDWRFSRGIGQALVRWLLAGQYVLVDVPVELRQLRYFVAVAEELHFGRAAERLHMSQSPLSRAIRELERELGLVLFVRTTRRVELTAAGVLLLERWRRALAEIDAAIADARRAAGPHGDVLAVGYGPFSRPVALRITEEVRGFRVRLDEEVTPDSLRRLAAHELAAAVVMETPAAARRHGVRIDTLRDEPLVAALPESHRYAGAAAVPVGAFVAGVVLLPRDPPGRLFNAWFRAVIRAAGFELDRTLETLSAPWDRRVLPVADGEAVCPIVGEWASDAAAGVVAVPFDPALSFPTDLASRWPPTDEVAALVEAACRVRDTQGWLTQRPARTELPED